MGKVSITIYNQGRAVVTDVRRMDVERGISEIGFSGIAEQIMPETVTLDAKDLQVLEQNLEYDLVSQERLFQKYLGEEIELTLTNDLVLQGRLLSADHSSLVLQNADGGLSSLRLDQVQMTGFPSLPEGLVSRPTLKWLVKNTRNAEKDIELSYLTRGIKWTADYVGVLSEDDTEMYFGCWITVENRSGAEYTNADLKLMAGDLNLEDQYTGQRLDGPDFMMDEAAAPKREFSEKSFFEYHMYTLSDPTTIRHNQDKQLALFPSRDIPVTKEFLYDYWRDDEHLIVSAAFDNSKAGNMGIPLPAGTVRIYKLDNDATRQFLGEDRIEHTPRDERVELTLGQVFDAAVEREVTSHEKVGKYGYRETARTIIRNHKDEPVTVVVREHMPYGAKMLQTSHKVLKSTATTVEMQVKIPGNTDKEVTFTYEYRRHAR